MINKKTERSLAAIAGGGSNAQLPSSCYTDSGYHELELNRFFENSWMAIGFASELPRTGMAKSVDVLGKPVLVTRDDQGKFHVFANICRHRGHILVEGECTNKKLLTCPYHAWSYDLKGNFVVAPFWDGTENSSPTSEEKSSMGLISIAFEIWYDIIFVNLSGKAEAFEKHIQELQIRWHQHRPPSLLNCFSQQSYSLNGNWKLVAENFLDNYHLPWIHPEIGDSIEASLGLEVENQRLSKDIIGCVHPTAGEEKNKIEKPLPCWPDDTRRHPPLSLQQDLFFIFPNTCLVMEGNYLWSMILMPTAVDQTDEKIALYVIGNQAMNHEYALSRSQLADIIYRINDQDSQVIKQLQTGRKMHAASCGIFNSRHDQLGKWFHQRISEMMSGDIGPQHKQSD